METGGEACEHKGGNQIGGCDECLHVRMRVMEEEKNAFWVDLMERVIRTVVNSSG